MKKIFHFILVVVFLFGGLALRGEEGPEPTNAALLEKLRVTIQGAKQKQQLLMERYHSLYRRTHSRRNIEELQQLYKELQKIDAVLTNLEKIRAEIAATD